MVHDPEIAKMKEVTQKFGFTGFIFNPNPKGEELILTLESSSHLYKACQLKRKANDLLKSDEKDELKKTVQALQSQYEKIFQKSREYFYEFHPLTHPKDPNPITLVNVDGTHYVVQISYEVAPNSSSITLKKLACEEMEEMDLRSQVLCYAKALWIFLTIPEMSKGKIPHTAERKIFAYSALEAKIYAILGFVPVSQKEALVKPYKALIEKTKAVRKEAEKAAEGKLKEISQTFPPDQQSHVQQALQKVKSKNNLREAFKSASANQKNLLYQVFRRFTKYTVEESFKKTKEAQIAFRQALEQAVSSLDCTSPQQFVTLTDLDQSHWTNAEKTVPFDLVELIEYRLQENDFYQTAKKS